MLEKVRNFIEFYHMIEKGDRIVMGISGGADSVALFLLLNQLKEEYNLELFAVHINHGIRQEAEEDADYVKKLCEDYQIPFYLFSADIPSLARKNRMTEEEMGREYRYRQFEQVMKRENADKLAVAHHMGDQAETVLFHLARGTNLAGMAGIRPVSDLTGERIITYDKAEERIVTCDKAGEGIATYDTEREKIVTYDAERERTATYDAAAINHETKVSDDMLFDKQSRKIIRPLLNCTKEELKAWLVENEVSWKEDMTNQDTAYARNKIRNQIVPLLEEINEQAVKHISEFADRAMEYESFFQKMVRKYIEEYVSIGKAECHTNRALLREQEDIFAMAVLYEMITAVCGAKKDIVREHVQAVYGLLGKQSGKKIQLPYETEAIISYEKLIIRKCFEQTCPFENWSQKLMMELPFAGKKMEQQLDLPGGRKLMVQILSMKHLSEDQKKQLVLNAGNLKNNYTKYFDCATIKDTLYVRTPETEDYFILNEQGDRKKLSRYFIDRKIPSEERRDKIIVTQGHEVLWVLGERRSATYRINEDTEYVLVLMYEGENDGLSY